MTRTDRIENSNDQLIRDEDIKLRLYFDSVGKRTIGVGRNLDDRGIRLSEALFMLQNDIDEATHDIDVNLPWTKNLDFIRKAVLVNMCFNLGITKLLKFKTFLGLVQAGKYSEAALDVESTPWYKEVGARAVRLMKQLQTGEWQ